MAHNSKTAIHQTEIDIKSSISGIYKTKNLVYYIHNIVRDAGILIVKQLFRTVISVLRIC